MPPRTAPPDRFDALLRAGREVFTRQGFLNAQMADVAKAMGVAKGTVYLYVESKQALFSAVVRQVASGGGRAPRPAALPIPTPAFGEILREVASGIRERMALPVLEAALAAPAPSGRAVRRELRGVVGELADLLRTHRDVIRLVDRCAHDAPELGRVWFEQGRVQLVGRLAAYLRSRAGAGCIPAVADTDAQARILLETLVMWTVHRRDDAAPQDLDEAEAHAMLIDFAVGGVLQGGVRR